MTNLKPQIFELLKNIKDAKQVSFFYPQNWAEDKLPAISYFESKNEENASVFDDGEFLSAVAFTVDIWALKPSECSTIAEQVDEKMASIGLRREFAMDLYEAESKLHHKSMRFGGLYQPSTDLIY